MVIRSKAVARLLGRRFPRGGRVVAARHRCTSIAVEAWRWAALLMRRNAGTNRFGESPGVGILICE